MKKQAKQKEARRVKKIEYPQEEFYEEEEIPEKDKDSIDIIAKKSILKNTEKTLTDKIACL